MNSSRLLPPGSAWSMTSVESACCLPRSRLAPRIEAVLAQGKGERCTVEDAFAALAVAMEEEDGGGDAA